MRYFGTEDRPSEKKVAGNDAVLAFVSFPGNEIKDLYVHEGDEGAPIGEETGTKEKGQGQLPAPPVKQSGPPAVPQANKQPRPPQPPRQQQQGQQRSNNNTTNNNRKNNNSTNSSAAGSNHARKSAATSAVGTGAHLLHLRERTAGSSAPSASVPQKPEGEFNFAEALTSFKKAEVLAEVASEQRGEQPVECSYKKDNFFDMLSSSSLDSQSGVRRERLTAGQERELNQDTFGAIALQQNNRYRSGGKGYGGRGGGGYGGRGGGGKGRGSHRSSNNSGGGGGNRNPVEAK